MQSTVRLFNTALARLGGEQLVLNISPKEQGVAGKVCDAIFPHILDMALAAHAWAFATRRVTLSSPALLNTTVNPEYPFAFALPEDCVKPIRLEGQTGVNRAPDFVVEGRTIRCGLEQATLAYVARIADPKQWPPQFADALAWGMAGELASSINNDAEKQKLCIQAYRVALADAVAVDRADQNPTRKKSEWTAARFGEGE